MKVILAGFSKTGTKSINEALTELGYDVYDYLEHFMHHSEEWMKILKGKGEISDFRKMYEDVDAVVDAPVFFYWHEIHQAFPDAKIILTTRDETSWLKSLENTLTSAHRDSTSFLGLYSSKFLPIVRRFNSFGSAYVNLFGVTFRDRWVGSEITINKMHALQRFRQHNAAVLQMAPKDNLLVFNVKEGWKPLCEFLGKEIPDKPFPHANIGGKGLYGLEGHEFTRKAGQQLFISIIVLLIICLAICYIFSDYSLWMGFSTFFCGFILLLLVL